MKDILDQTGKSSGDTPLMTQYHAIKAKHRDAVLFFRMGDFFEMFGEDAKIGSRVLGITLTSRGHGKAGEVPLAGFPHHALDGYLSKMIRAGYRVAVCEQVEDPKLAKGVVKREVIQVVTPGTVTSDSLLEAFRNNFLSAFFCKEGTCGLASADVTTGQFMVTEFSREKLADEIHSIGPREILVPESQAGLVEQEAEKSGILATRREDWLFSRDYGYEALTRHFGTKSLKGFGCEDLDSGISAAGMVLTYVQETQRTQIGHIRRLFRYGDYAFMMLDAATRPNLEIVSSAAGDRRDTMIGILDRTRTAMGGRTLAAWIQRPLKRLEDIRQRLDAVSDLKSYAKAREDLVSLFKGMADLERLCAKTVTRRANPRDLAGLRRSLLRIPDIAGSLNGLESARIKNIASGLDGCTDLCDRIGRALADDPPVSAADGHVIRKGYNAELDELRELAFSGKDWIARAQVTERERTKIPSLKVGYNRVFGYYIEVTNPHLEKIPDNFIRKQTLVNAERFITPELKEMEERILHAEERISSLESSLFDELRQDAARNAEAIQEDGRLVGELDALLSLAQVAEENRYVCPELDEGDGIRIEEGRHPVVEQRLPPDTPFIPNDCHLDNSENQILIITGPNMAGKSTYIRQVGLIVLLAQVGSFVPAKAACIGIVDRIFTRVGAQDNVAGGESTFLVEMNEAAAILNNATRRSLILLDEIGRGTSTFDGLSIAWAVAEYIHHAEHLGSKTLFATHYHELTELERILPRVRNFNVAVKEWGEHIVFLRKILPGGCDHSYGIQVARLAGMPPEVLERAREILHNLEANELTPNEIPKLAVGQHGPVYPASGQLNLFLAEEKRIRDMLEELDISSMTPLEALQKLDELKKLTGG